MKLSSVIESSRKSTVAASQDPHNELHQTGYQQLEAVTTGHAKNSLEYLSLAYNYARTVIKGRWPEAEETISTDPFWAYAYARDIIKGRWPEAEETISKNPHYACEYAKDVIKGRWPEAEPTISTDPYQAYYYALSVIKGRWPEGEQAISKNPHLIIAYARHVIKRRWPEAEAVLCDTSLSFSMVKDYVSKIDWANPLNDFPIPKRIFAAIMRQNR